MKLTFKEKIWRHSSAGWFIVSVPAADTKRIRANFADQEEGWGRLKTEAQIGGLKWSTALWFDTKSKRYLLPIKAEIRKALKLSTGSRISVALSLEDAEAVEDRFCSESGD
jgi:hypothetical protein